VADIGLRPGVADGSRHAAWGLDAAFVEVILGAIAIAWLVAIVFVGVYNQLLSLR
jgi:hypothetical protein